MPTPTRPVTGAPIESVWGQEVQDAAFAPAGGRWHSQSTALTGTGLIAWVADSDPGGWLAAAGATALVVPADGAGLYLISGNAVPSTGQASQMWRWEVRLNTIAVAGASGYTDVSVVAVYFPISATISLAVGDSITAALQGPPSTGRLNIPLFTLTRVGRAWGAP